MTDGAPRMVFLGFGKWARKRDVAGVMISHERLDRLFGQIMPTRLARRAADFANRRTAADYDAVVCTTEFACEEFRRIGAENTRLKSGALWQSVVGLDVEGLTLGGR